MAVRVLIFVLNVWYGRVMYGENWTSRSRKMKKMFRYTCQKCGVIMDGFDKDSVQVHHIDMNPLNCFYWNLVVLCPECHVDAHRKR